MGAKAGILALGDQDSAESLRQPPPADAEQTAALVAEIFPGYQVEPCQSWPLEESTYPRMTLQHLALLPGHCMECAPSPSRLRRHS